MTSDATRISINGTQVEDESGLEREPERGNEIEVPFDPTKIDIIAKPMTISALKSRLENRELDLTPDFQRQANVWDAKRKARLIESVLLRIPLPSFYLSEDADGSYSVVDGLQRLCAIFHFMDVQTLEKATGAKLPPLQLNNLQYLKELEGATFSKLERKFQRRITELEISTNIIRSNTPSAVKFNVFARLNQGGMPLTAQEIRNAIFPGAWRGHIREMAECREFLEATERKIQTDRQQDMELVLRFVALWRLGVPNRRPPGQTLDEFLNVTVEEQLSSWTAEDWLKVSKAFRASLVLSMTVLHPHQFRKIGGGPNRKPINRGLFEAELIAIGGLSESELVQLARRRERLRAAIELALKPGTALSQSLLYATGSAEASNVRIARLRQIIQELLADD